MGDQQKAAKEFAAHWADKGYEKGESQRFWLALLHRVYGVEEEKLDDFIKFEEQVHLDHTSFIDAYIPSTRVMIEQKALGKDLGKAIRQSDGSFLTPFQQAKRYIVELPVDEHPRWVITCNFAEFWVYDMNNPNGEPEIIKLADLGKEYYRLQFLVERKKVNLRREKELSIQAGEIVGKIYDAFYKQYRNPGSKEALHSLNVLCVRLVFCLYAENAGIFDRRSMFHDYLAAFDARQMRKALIDLFDVLDKPEKDRDTYLKDDNPDLAAFPYVNGGLFSDKDIEIPPFTEEIRDMLLEQASAQFDWSEISPTIFGAVFESTLNPETRRKGGMHYTSVENIRKVLGPLFLDELEKEFADICGINVRKTEKKKLVDFQKKLASLTFLDPACGSGNFLTETYISLRRLENDVLRELSQGQISFGDENWSPIQVSISQFYGIEINDFAVTVAKTALWIAESQMMKETESIVLMHLDFLPLKTNACIVEGNALRMDWETVVPKNKLSYIMGNPPFVGYAYQSQEQKEDLRLATNDIGKNIDYVVGWYFKAAPLLKSSNIRAAFVSTNSITQGEQVAVVWKPLHDRFGIHIDFAYRTFIWDSEASLKAHVHCVIIGFSTKINTNSRMLYEYDQLNEVQTCKKVQNINAYLIDAPTIFIPRRKEPICDVPKMIKGSQPTDNGYLIITPNDYEEFIAKDPNSKKFIKPFLGAEEYINKKARWCLWLKDASPKEIRECPMIMQRVQKVKEFRLKSKKAATRKQAEIPTLFTEIRQPKTNYILVPRVSSERRVYVPMGFISSDIIASDAVHVIPDATLYNFGVLTSNVHMAWMRAVAGRLEMRYRYSNDIVYNNFPWPNSTDAQKAKIEETAQAILDARALYPDSSLADLYDELAMPPELRKAHQQNDIAVLAAYGFKKGDTAFKSESACVAELMKLYKELVDKD